MHIYKRLRLQRNIIATIVRILPGKGKLTVQMGQEITPDEIIGTSTQQSGFRIINVASLLEADPSSVEHYLKRQAGQRIYKGELLACREGGLFKGKKIVISPTDGVIDFINLKSGEIKISFLPKRIDLPAGVFGIVGFVDHVHSKVLIKTQITKIYGVFGSGRNREGYLRVLDPKQELIDSRSVSVKDAEHILVGRNLIYKDAISAAISSNVSGIITGGINAKDYRGMAGGYLAFPKKFDNDIGISIVVCEGFGSVPIGGDIFDLLAQYNQKFVFIDGNQATVSLPADKSDCMMAIRRTALPPSVEADLKEPLISVAILVDVKLGAKVRVVGVTYLGEQGKIIAVDNLKTRLASGVLSQLVTIETKTRKIQIPVSNIEII